MVCGSAQRQSAGWRAPVADAQLGPAPYGAAPVSTITTDERSTNTARGQRRSTATGEAGDSGRRRIPGIAPSDRRLLPATTTCTASPIAGAAARRRRAPVRHRTRARADCIAGVDYRSSSTGAGLVCRTRVVVLPTISLRMREWP